MNEAKEHTHSLGVGISQLNINIELQHYIFKTFIDATLYI